MNQYTVTATYVPLLPVNRDDLLASALGFVEQEVVHARVTGPQVALTVVLGVESDSDTLVVEDADRLRNAPGMPPVDNVKVYRHSGRRRNLISEAR